MVRTRILVYRDPRSPARRTSGEELASSPNNTDIAGRMKARVEKWLLLAVLLSCGVSLIMETVQEDWLLVGLWAVLAASFAAQLHRLMRRANP